MYSTEQFHDFITGPMAYVIQKKRAKPDNSFFLLLFHFHQLS